MPWTDNGAVTLSVAGANLNVSGITASTHGLFIFDTMGSVSESILTFNNDTNSNYSYSSNEYVISASDVQATSQSNIPLDVTTDHQHFGVVFLSQFPNRDKLGYAIVYGWDSVAQNNRLIQVAFSYSPSPDSYINEININKGTGADFLADSTLKTLYDSNINRYTIQDKLEYQETDTGKTWIYNKSNDTWSEVNAY